MKKTKLFYKVWQWTYDRDIDFDEDYQKDWRAREEFAFDVLKLRRIERKLHRLDENACNGWPRLQVEYKDGRRYEYHVEDEFWRKRDERAESLAEKQLDDLSARWGESWHHQSDPRGGAVKSEGEYTVRFRGLDIGEFVYEE